MFDKKIDFHTHYLPESYVHALKKNVVGAPDGWPTPEWTPETTLNFMQENHIAYSVLSLSSPHISFGDKQETLSLADDVNAVGNQLQSDYPGQLGFLATLPLPYVKESVAMIDKAYATYRAVGITLPTNCRGIYIGNPIFDPIYDALNAQHAIVALHPGEPSAWPLDAASGLPIPLLGFFVDTTVTFMNLLKYRFFARYPNIRLIIPHAGAFLSILTDRVAGYVKQNYQTDIFAVMKHCYFDTAGSSLPRQLPALLSLADPERILYGSDIPYTQLKRSRELGLKLEETPLITEEQKTAIFSTNAARLLNRI